MKRLGIIVMTALFLATAGVAVAGLSEVVDPGHEGMTANSRMQGGQGGSGRGPMTGGGHGHPCPRLN